MTPQSSMTFDPVFAHDVLLPLNTTAYQLSWAQALCGWTDEARASQWCDKQVAFDPDLWIVEIEDREGRAFVDEPII